MPNTTPAALRELDGLIAVAFDGYWTRIPRHSLTTLEYCRRDGEKIRFGGLETMVPRYTSSLDEAVAFLDRFMPGVWWIIGRGKMTADEPEFGTQLQFGTTTLSTAEAETAPMSVIAAVILALPDGTINAARAEVAKWFAEQAAVS